MNCPLCGAANAAGQRFCKRCGNALAQTAPAGIERVRQTEHGWDIENIEAPGVSVKRLAALFWSIAVFSMISLIVLFGVSVPLTIFNASRAVLIPLYMFGSTAIVLIAGMLIKQVSRLITMMEQDRRESRHLPHAAQSEQPQLPSQPPAFRSVTEHTTRNFDVAYREPQAHD